MGQRSNINDVQVGLDTKINVVSQTHGRKRVPMAQTCVFTPKKTVNAVGEFDDRNPVLVYETYEGVDVAFETIQADQVSLDSMVMDLDPNQAVIVNDPANQNEVTAIYTNFTGRNTGYQYGFEYAEKCHLSASPSNHSLKTPTKRSNTFMGTRYFRAMGKTGQKCALQYVRFTDGSPTFATADDVLMGSHSTGTFPNTPIAYPLPAEENAGTTLNYISAFWTKSGTTTKVALIGNLTSNPTDYDFQITNGIFTLHSGGQAGIPSGATSAGDIIEFFVVVQPASPIS